MKMVVDNKSRSSAMVLILGIVFVCVGNSFGQVTGNNDPLYNTSQTGTLGDHDMYKISPCKSTLEKNEMVAMMDTNTALVHVGFGCLCNDYLMDIQVVLSNVHQSYSAITDRSGCKFIHIQPGVYQLKIKYPHLRKFKPVAVEIKSGGMYEMKIILCKK